MLVLFPGSGSRLEPIPAGSYQLDLGFDMDPGGGLPKMTRGGGSVTERASIAIEVT